MPDVGRAAALVVITAGLLAVAAPVGAAEVDLGAFSGPVRFEAPQGAVLDLGDRRYVGTIEAGVGPDGGLTVVDEVSLDEYLEGLAEVPVRWPGEALRAQVIAARTYAWWELEQGVWDGRGYGICATQACQVFAGRDVIEDDPMGRWAGAVASTTGQVLVDSLGEPLLARYSSSNGGASRANIEVFPDDGDRPYLQSVLDPYDAASPFHTWQVRFAREDLDAILARGETLAAAVPLVGVRLVEVPRDEDLVEVTGRDGTTASVTASEFRSFVTATAPDIDPDAYPPLRGDGSGRRLPATLLSSQVGFTVSDDQVTVDGRGFGHGVGMSQYGALGRAEAGFTATEILAAYYGGITPTTHQDLPEQVRVGLVDGGQTVDVTPSAPTRVTVGDTELTTRALGGWRVEIRPDRTVRLLAPEGYGVPLVADPTVTDRSTPWATEIITLGTVINKHVELEVEVRDTDGEVVVRTPVGIAGPGRHNIEWSLDGPDGGLLAPGDYDVALVAIDEEGTRAGAAVPLSVRTPTVATTAAVLGPAPATPTGPDRPRNVLLAVVLGAVVGAGGSLLLSERNP